VDFSRFEPSRRRLIPFGAQITQPEGFTFVANIKSQIKRIKTNEKARLRNKSVRSSFKTAIRRFRDAVASGDSKAIATELESATRELDVAVSKGVIHANQAANKKSAMAKSAHKAGVR
jgi:small subunit ribosomal protein S20